MKLSRYRRSHTAVTTVVTCHVLHKEALHEALSSGRFPHVWRSIRKWVIRQAFIRGVRAIVTLRRTAESFDSQRVAREGVDFKAERDRLIAIGRASKQSRNKMVENGQHRDAKNGKEKEGFCVSAAELHKARWLYYHRYHYIIKGGAEGLEDQLKYTNNFCMSPGSPPRSRKRRRHGNGVAR